MFQVYATTEECLHGTIQHFTEIDKKRQLRKDQSTTTLIALGCPSESGRTVEDPLNLFDLRCDKR